MLKFAVTSIATVAAFTSSGTPAAPTGACGLEFLGSGTAPKYPHQEVYDEVVYHLNAGEYGTGTSRSAILERLDDDATLCMPYPFCISGAEIMAYHAEKQPLLLDTFAVPTPLSNMTTPWQDNVGGVWIPSWAISVRGSTGAEDVSGPCMYSGPVWVQWIFHENSVKLSDLNFFYDQEHRAKAAKRCGTNSFMVKEADENPVTQESKATLQGLFDYLGEMNGRIGDKAIPANCEEWSAGWAALYDLNDPDLVGQCDPNPSCDKDVAGFFKRICSGVGRTFTYPTSQMMFAGDIAFGMFSWASTTPVQDGPGTGGCLGNHIQMSMMQLSKTNPKKINQFQANYAMAVHNNHECRK